MISIGTRWTEQAAPPRLRSPRVTGFANDLEAGVEFLKGHGIEIVKDEPAPFFSSLIVGLAEKFGMRATRYPSTTASPPRTRSP